MKMLLVVTSLLMLVGTVNAKVACAPDVNQTICKDAATHLNSFLDHGILPGIDIPVEIVTAKEYAKRLADMEDNEARAADLYPGGWDAIVTCKTCFSPFRKHILANFYDGKVSFIRDRPSAGIVERILISSEYFEGFTLSVQGGADEKVNGGAGSYYPPKVSELLVFIGGYLCGTMSTINDDSVRVEIMEKHFKKEQTK